MHQIPIRSESGLFITELMGSQDTINMIIHPSMGMGVCYLCAVDRAVPSCFKVCQFKLDRDRSAAHWSKLHKSKRLCTSVHSVDMHLCLFASHLCVCLSLINQCLFILGGESLDKQLGWYLPNDSEVCLMDAAGIPVERLLATHEEIVFLLWAAVVCVLEVPELPCCECTNECGKS